MIKAFWIVYELIMLGGAVAWGLLVYKYARLYKSGKEHIDEHIKKWTDKGLNRAEAYNLVYAKKQSALIRCISSASIVFCFAYAIIDILFVHIIGG